MANAIIGAIPGYNMNIDPNGFYAKKIMSNINRVILTPTGYSLNLGGSIASVTSLITDLVSDGSSLATRTDGQLFKLGSDVNSGNIGYGENTVSTQTAMTVWENILKASASAGSNKLEKLDTNATGLEILCTNDSTFSEVFSNNYKPSWLDSKSSEMMNQVIGKFETLKNINTAVASFDSDAGRAMLRGTGSSNVDILGLLSGKALGYQTTLPKEWMNSNYTSGLQLMIRLISPSGHWKDINKYILNPILYILAAASPVTYNGISFGFPMMWKLQAEGMQTVECGAISTLTIQRGGTDTLFNQWSQPLNVDLRISFESVIDGFAIPIGTKFANDTLVSKSTVVPGPLNIVDSFTYLTSNLTPKEISVKL